MRRSLSGVAPTIICVDCPPGTKRGALRYRTRSCAFSRMPSRMRVIGARILSFVFCGARRVRLSFEGSSILTLMRSASSPSARISASSAPGIAFTWM